MASDSDESFYENDSPDFAFSPGAGTTAALNDYNCTVGENSKRKVSIPPGGSRCHELSANRAGSGGGLDGICSEHPRKRRKGGQNTTPDSSQDPSYACPYYKNNPEKNANCAGWNKRDIHRVKEHIKRSHLKPIQCPRCNVYRAGDKGQIHIHLRDGECQKARNLAVVESDVLAKAKALERRSLSWERIYQILFPGSAESEIPSPFWQNHTEPSAAPKTKLESSPTGTYSGDAFEERLHEELGGFVRYFQSQVPRLVQEMFCEYQRLRGLKFEYPFSTSGGVDSAAYSPPEAQPSDPPNAPPSTLNAPPNAPPTPHLRTHLHDADSERGFSNQPNTGKDNPRPDQGTEKPARKPTARRRQGAPSPSIHPPEVQRPGAPASLSHEQQGGQKPAREDRSAGKPTGDGVRRRHSTAPPLAHPQHTNTQHRHQQNGQRQPQQENFTGKSTGNGAQMKHDASSAFIHQHEPQHSSDMSKLGQDFAALKHNQDNKGPSDNIEAPNPQLTATDPDRNNGSPPGFEDFGETESSSSGPEPGSGYDPAVIWGLDLLNAYDWRF